MAEVTAYVDRDGDLLAADTNELIRRATRDEREESRSEFTGTGCIRADVSERTIRRRCPRYAQQMMQYRGWI